MGDAEAIHMFVHGHVQGVFYRANTQKAADRLRLTGWVKNCEDGSVEIHAEGDKDKLEELIEWCRHGPALAKVSKIDLNWIDSQGLRSFDVV
ncbi:MAG: acylphosphatase [Nitrospinae bacterium]|nr:acylphosphatase [Nitrospinota bacterium]